MPFGQPSVTVVLPDRLPVRITVGSGDIVSFCLAKSVQRNLRSNQVHGGCFARTGRPERETG